MYVGWRERERVREESSKVRRLWGYWRKGLNPAAFALYGPHLRHLVGTPEPTLHLRSSPSFHGWNVRGESLLDSTFHNPYHAGVTGQQQSRKCCLCYIGRNSHSVRPFPRFHLPQNETEEQLEVSCGFSPC